MALDKTGESEWVHLFIKWPHCIRRNKAKIESLEQIQNQFIN